MEIATPAATIYTTLQHDVAEEEEEKCPKTYEQQSVLININPTLSLQSTTSQDDELHLSIYSPTLTPTMPLTPPPTSREPYQMPTFLLYQNDSKIEPQEENSASLIEDFGAASTNLPLTPCPICSRKFNSTTFTKHVSICQKTATKRRKVFDSSRQRREGTDLAAYPIPKGYGLPPQPNVLNTKRRDRSNSPLQASDMKTPLVTRKKSVGNNMQTTISTNDELIRSTVRSSMSSKVKGSTTGANNNTMSNSTTDGSNFVRDRMRSSERVNAKRSLATQSDQCPHCDRCFGLKAFDRHVEWCKEKALQAAIKTPLKSEPNAAMERLQARTKYRAPCLKTKRTVTRDKYSGMNSEDNGTSIDGLKNKEELAIISTNNAPTSNKTIRDCPSNNNSSIMSQSMTSSILSERKIQLGEVIRYKEEGIDIETKQNYMRIDGESALNVKKHIPNLMFSNLSVRPNKTQVVSPMDDKLQDILKKNAPRKVRNNKKAVELFVGKPSVWVNPDGTLDSDMPLRGLQPRRNSRENSKIIVTESIKPTKKINVRRMGSDTDLVVKSKLSKSMKLAVKTQDPNDLRACNSASSILNLNTVTSQIELGMCNIPITLDVGTLNKPKRKASPLLLSANAHSIKEPMKALPLDQEIYGQLLNIKTIESTHMIRDIESNMKNIKALPVQNSSKSDKCLTPRPTTFQRSMSYTVISGGLHVDKYDPFLSAKRQLEELCSPTDTDMALPTLPTLTSSFCINNKKPTSASTPTTPALPKKSMTMSLNYGSAAIPSTNDTNMHQNTRQILTKTPTPTVTNNFRRTSSLRGPRRSPLLTTRPLFVHNYRPTIQRGLSDEGPISTNFLKPEEYDEMPVRSVCVNDFALTKSPRVVRRDLNAITNRKQNMKLNLHNKNNTNPITTSTTTGAILEDNKELSKTDSLAVFLKYEKDLERELTAKLEKLQQDNAMKAAALEFPDINTNTLSKPNAFNGLRLEPLLNTQTESAKKDLLLLTPITTTKTTTTTTEEPATTTIRANKEPLEKLNDDEKIINVKPQAVINLDIIFNKPQQQKHHHEKEQQQEHHHEKEEEEQVQEQEQSAEIRDTYKLASSTENIDPKLINKFDNLPLNTKLLRPLDDNQVKYSLQQNNNNKSNKRPPTPPPRKTQHSESKIFNDNHNKNNNDYLKKILKNTSVTTPTNLPANTTGGFSLLKRKLRLDRNQFLYDDGVNSAEEKTDFSHNSQLDQNIASNNPIMPVFDDFNFDFEEFLSSFEHDDEQFPLFKDCKEFLSNRITNKQRASVSTQNTIYTPTSSSIISYVKFPQLINNNYFESQHSPCATEEIKRNYNNNRMEVGAIGNSSTAATTNSDGDGEIFISIEAEQSDSGKSPISPASLRNMVGNSQTVVEIHEVGALNDTKFSKISDNDDYDDHNNNNKDIGDSFTKKTPNVQFNNAKNLTQIKQHPNKNIIRPSGDANEDSDDINSSSTITTITTTTRPIRRTLNHKNSSESFNRSIESSTPVPRGLVNLTRPATATGNLPIAQPTIIQQSQNVQQQQFYKTKGQKSRSNQCVYKDMISSSSSSETSLPPIDFHNKNFHMPHVINNNNNNNNNYSTQQQQELFTSYGKKISSQNSSKNNNNSTSHSRRGSNSRINQSSMETNNSNHNHESHVMMMMMNQNEPNNNNNNATYINSMTSASNNNLELTGMHSSTTSSNPSMTSSACKRMSKFCHECGSKFIVEQAKFCMDCGVKRIIL